VVAFWQGYASMSFPTKKREEIVLAGEFVHGGHPVLRWMAGNVSIETDAADNWKPSKTKSIERIDGIVALIMALERASRHDELKSVYELRGTLFITADDGWRVEDKD
jgi:phage terminase large subunit-like protein